MSDEFKTGHISDLHYCPEHLEEVDRCTSFAINKIIEERCSCCVISGDLFDHRVDLHDPCVYQIIKRVKQLSDCMPVLILQGTHSHDSPGALNVFKKLSGDFPIYVADHIGQVLLTRNGDNGFIWNPCDYDSKGVGVILDDDIALFSCLPPVHKGQLASDNSDDIAKNAGEYVYDLMRGWSVTNEKANTLGLKTIFVSHGTVNGSMTEQGVPMHGNDHEFTTGSLFASKSQAIMLGHIHQFQQWSNPETGQRIAYPGSPGRLHFGELTDKGFIIWEFDQHEAYVKFHQTPAKKLLQIEFDGEPDIEQLKMIAESADDAHVRIRYVLDENNRHCVDRQAIEALFKNSAAVKTEPSIRHVTRTRAEGITKNVSVAEKLETWCQSTGNNDAFLIKNLTGKLHDLMNGDPESIINRTTQKKEAA